MRTVADVMVPTEEVATVSADHEVSRALSHLGEGAHHGAVLVDHGRIVGILSGSDVSRAIELEQARGLAETPTRSPGVLVWVVVTAIIVLAGASVPPSLHGHRPRPGHRRRRRK